MIYKVKYKTQYSMSAYGVAVSKPRLFHIQKVFVIEKGSLVDTSGQSEIDSHESRLWYKKCTYTEITNTVLISMLQQGTNIQKILALNIIFLESIKK